MKIFKFFEQIFDFLFGKIPTITMTLILIPIITWMNLYIFKNGYSMNQFNLIVFPPLMCFLSLMILNGVKEKKWKYINYAFMAVCVLCSIGLSRDYKSRPFHYEESNTKIISIVQLDSVSKTYIIIVPGVTYKTDKELKFDSLNPLKIYDNYKIDIFGKKSMPTSCIKSNLMKDYVFLTNWNRN